MLILSPRVSADVSTSCPSACRDSNFRPARNDFNFGNKKESHGARSEEYVGEAKQLLFLSSKTPKLLRRYERGHCQVDGGYV